MHKTKLSLCDLNPEIILASFYVVQAGHLTAIYPPDNAMISYLVVEGQMEVTYQDGSKRVVNPGQIANLYAGIRQFRESRNQPLSIYQVNFRPSPRPELWQIPYDERLGFLPEKVDVNQRLPDAISCIELCIQALVKLEPGWELTTKAAILQLINLMFNSTVTGKKPPSLHLNRWDRLLAKLEETEAMPSVKSMAKDFRLSQVHFINCFRNYTGFTPKQYVLQRRLWKARKMLQEGAMVKEAALSCGFSNQLYFSRMYKKQFNHRPSDAQRFPIAVFEHPKNALPVSRHIFAPGYSYDTKSRRILKTS